MKKISWGIFISVVVFPVCVAFSGNEVFAQHTVKWIAPSFADTLKNAVRGDQKSLIAAKKIYNNLCWSCHGLDGKGDGPASVNCNPKPADHTSTNVQKQSDGAIFWKISTGNGVMQPYVQLLTSKQRWMLVNYIRSFIENDARK